MPRSAPRVLGVVLAIALAAGCHDSSGPSNPYDRVTGAWVTEQLSIDEIGGSGHLSYDAPLRLEMQRDGDYVVTEDGTVIDSGTVALQADSLRFHSAVTQGADADFAMSWRFDQSALVLSQSGQWDFGGNEAGAVPARVTYRFVRP